MLSLGLLGVLGLPSNSCLAHHVGVVGEFWIWAQLKNFCWAGSWGMRLASAAAGEAAHLAHEASHLAQEAEMVQWKGTCGGYNASLRHNGSMIGSICRKDCDYWTPSKKCLRDITAPSHSRCISWSSTPFVASLERHHIPWFILYKCITLVVLEKFWIRTPNFGNPQSHFRSSSGLTMEPKCKIFGTHSRSIDGLAPVGSKVSSTGTTIGEKKMAEDLGNMTRTWRFGHGLLSYSLTSIWQVWQVFACILKYCRCKVWSCNF